jgi:hypothetical protein
VKIKINEEQLLGEIAKQNFVIFLILTGLSLFWTSFAVTLGVVVGGLISIGGYTWLHGSLKKMMKNPDRQAGRKFQFSYVLRLIALGLTLFLAIAILKVNPVALCFGLSVVVLSILVGTLRYI